MIKLDNGWVARTDLPRWSRTVEEVMSPRLQRILRRMRPRRERPSERVVRVVSIIVLALGTAWSIANNNKQVKVAGVIIIVVVLSSLVLSMRGMLILSAAVVLCLATVFKVHGMSPNQLSISGFVMIGTALVVAVVQASRRDR